MDGIENEGRQRTIKKLLHGLSWYTHEELALFLAAQGIDSSKQISAWLQERRIFRVQGDCILYPQFQFDTRCLPLPVIKEVLECFNAKETWAIAAWFYFPNGWIGQEKDGKVVAVAPLDVLNDTEMVLNAARRQQNGTYVA